MNRYISRRDFTKKAVLGLTAAALPYSRVLGAHEDIRVGIIGLGIWGSHHVSMFGGISGCRVAALCDVDPQVLHKHVEELKKENINLFSTTDPREIMDRKDIDAVVIATPNHWHALLTVWACQAGKDVYVEKPASHSIAEGQHMLEAAARYDRIVQVGTQSRSCTGLLQAVPYVQEGHLGKILYIHALWYRQRDSIGKVPPWRPDWLDYDMFCGPSPNVPLEREKLHYDWHWMWNTGNGDLGNLGIHKVDMARWFLNSNELPRRVMSVGGRYVFDDAGQTPNTQLTLFDFGRVPVLMENRNLPVKPGLRAMDIHRGTRSGVIVQCENGAFIGDTGGGWAYDKNGQRIKQFVGDGGGGHPQNFIDTVRSRRKSDLKAPLATGHLSTACCLFGNISYRLGKPASCDEIKTQIAGHTQGQETLERIEKHLAANNVDLKENPLRLGPWLNIDIKSQEITAIEGVKDAEILKKAVEMTKGDNHRKPYTIS